MTVSTPIITRREPSQGDGKPHPGRRLTEREFMEWVDDTTRAEWIDGEIIVMPPASLDHANFSSWLQGLVRQFVKRRGLGFVYGTDVLVKLPGQRRRRMPDLLFVSKERAKILRPTSVEGAPDLIMEVVSPESVSRDWREKYIEYQKAGVREYWVIHRQSDRVEAYALDKTGKYRGIAPADDKITSTVLKGFHLRLSWLLAPEPPDLLSALAELGIK